MFGLSTLRFVAYVFGTAGGLSGAAYGLLNGQSRHARRVIGTPSDLPLCADGTYLPDGTGPLDAADLPTGTVPLSFAVLGDSTGAGLGVDHPDDLLGVRLARGVATELQRPVTLTTYAIVGTTSKGLVGQVEAARAASPELALILVGANDVTTRLPIGRCAALLGEAVETLVSDGVSVVAGTCPDLGAIRPIPQPLRSVARTWSLRLGRAQRRAVEAVGGRSVPLADLLSPEFLTRPSELFSPDHFHPSAAGYEATSVVLVPALCDALGEWRGAVPQPPTRSRAAEARRPTSRIVARLNHALLRRGSNT